MFTVKMYRVDVFKHTILGENVNISGVLGSGFVTIIGILFSPLRYPGKFGGYDGGEGDGFGGWGYGGGGGDGSGDGGGAAIEPLPPA